MFGLHKKIQFRNFPFDLEVVPECLKISNCVDHKKLWKILKVLGIPDYLICLLRNLYAGQEAIVRTGHGTTDWFQIGKGVCLLSPCLFNLQAEYIMQNVELDAA